MATIEERLAAAEKEIADIKIRLDAAELKAAGDSLILDALAYFMQENLSRRERRYGLTESERKQYIKINNRIVSILEEALKKG